VWGRLSEDRGRKTGDQEKTKTVRTRDPRAKGRKKKKKGRVAGGKKRERMLGERAGEVIGVFCRVRRPVRWRSL